MKLLAISGSLREKSSNKTLLQAASRLAPEGVEIILYEGLGNLPYFNPDLEGREPALVADLKRQVREADGLLFSSPEYAHGVPGSLKNALDWLVGSVEFVNKPVALYNASPRATFAQDSLKEIIRTMSGFLVAEGSVAIPLLGKKIEAEEIRSDPEMGASIKRGLERLIQAILQRRQKP